MILADTSAWIEFDRATGSPAHLRLRDLVASGEGLAVTELVMAELLMGATGSDAERLLRRALARFPVLGLHPVVDCNSAVAVYRRCQREGVTPRGLVDCQVAAVALRTRSTLLAHDADLARIARVVSLDLDPASLA